MSVFSKLVVGLDGSAAAEHALRWAANRLREHGELHVVHSGAPAPTVPEDVEVTTIHSRDMAPADALIGAARELDADAIVVGPHGSGLGIGLGSVTKHLLRESPVPVIIIDGFEPPRSAKAPVVACVGYGDPAQAAAAWAAAYAAEHDLPLVLLHSVAYRPVFPVDSASDALASYLGQGVSTEWAMDELKKIGEALHEKHPDLAISAHVDHRSVIKAVKAANLAELVVLGKRSDEEFLHVIGTPRLRRLVARMAFPTVVVPPDVEVT